MYKKFLFLLSVLIFSQAQANPNISSASQVPSQGMVSVQVKSNVESKDLLTRQSASVELGLVPGQVITSEQANKITNKEEGINEKEKSDVD